MADTIFSSGTVVASTWLQDSNDHTYDKGAGVKHAASKISVTPTVTITSTNVQAALEELSTAVHRNRIINGAMRVSVRGTSFPAAASGSYTLDRWAVGQSGGGVATISQQADGPNAALATSLRWEVTTADAAIAAGDFALVSQKIEGYNVAGLIGRPFTISFWARSSKTGIHCVALRNSGLDRSYVAEYTITAANTWEFKTITVAGGLITAGTWNWTTGTGLEVDFCLATGTTYQTAPGAWQTGNYIGTANQVNCLDTVGNIFAITGVQLEPGAVATNFEHRMIEELLCQRYARLNGCLAGWSHTTTSINGAAVDFGPVPMRAAPALTLVTGTSKGHDIGVASRNISAPSWTGSSIGGYIDCTIATTTGSKLHNILPGAILFTAEL